jgi:hypothetical protein
MSSFDHIVQPEPFGPALNADRSLDADELPELIAADDPTEDLANDVTSELANLGTSARLAPPPVIDAAADTAANDAIGSASDATSGTVLRERYVLEQQLGGGGTAVIFRARDLRRDQGTDDSQRVAIKLLRPQFRDRVECIARIKREFHQTQSLAHPNVLRVHDLDCDRGTWFIAMEFLAGEALDQRLRRASSRGLSAREAWSIVAACTDALAFAHEHGVTHGDVKPGNIFLTAGGELRLLDFGVAPVSSAASSPTGGSATEPIVAAATRAYASPEVLAGQGPEPRDDVFSLACVIYEMLTGRHPYGRLGADQARDAGVEIAPLPGLSERQWHALSKGLAWHRELRPDDIRELQRVLLADVPAGLPMQETVAAPARAIAAEPQRRSTRKRRGAAAILIATVAAIVLGALLSRVGLESPGAPQFASRTAPAIKTVTGPGAATERIAAGAGATAGPQITAPKAATPTPVTTGPQPLLPPGRVSFDVASMVVSSRAVMAAIPVRHLDETGRVAWVAWRATNGTALAGRDYGGPPDGVASFEDGHALRMIYVPIVNDSRKAGDRSFTVELTGVSPDTTLGPVDRIMVTIRGD